MVSTVYQVQAICSRQFDTASPSRQLRLMFPHLQGKLCELARNRFPATDLVAAADGPTIVGMDRPPFADIFGVDFSGAKRAGESIWVARVVPRRAKRGPPFALADLDRLDRLAGTAARGPALAHLVALVRASESALWGFDFPFGLPVELFPPGTAWADQFAFLRAWGDDAYGCGVECVRRAVAGVGRMHVRRTTDTEAKAPLDCYHYRIIYQTFFGMRDVVGRLRSDPRTAVVPFQPRKFRTAARVVVECCPGSVLKRLGLPHQTYKQPTGGPLTPTRRQTRHAILAGLRGLVAVGATHHRVMMRNPGGDALDAVLAAVGSARAVPAADHRAIARHPRYPREGYLFA